MQPRRDVKEVEHPVDPWKYLIDLEIKVTKGSLTVPNLLRYPASVQTYLRMLGRCQDVLDLKPSPEKLAQAELAGGWCLLRRMMYAKVDDEKRRGVYFDPGSITAEAVRKCPTMPWLYNLDRDQDEIRNQLRAGTTLYQTSDAREREWLRGLSPYVRISCLLELSNVIVPLPEPCSIARDDPRWEDLVQALHCEAHPVRAVGNNRDIMHTNNEKLVMAASDERLNPEYFKYPDRNLGVDKEKDEAYLDYLRDVQDLDV